MLIRDNYLSLSYYAVESFIDVIDEYRTNITRQLQCIFDEHDVFECEFVNRFTFTVCNYIERVCFFSLQSVGNFITNPSCQEGFPVMVQCNESAYERVICFGDRYFSVIFSNLK